MKTEKMKKIIFIALALLALVSTNAKAQYISANNTTIKIEGDSQTGGKILFDLHDAADCVALGFRIQLPAEIYEYQGVLIESPIYLIDHDTYNYGKRYLIVSDDNDTFNDATTFKHLSLQANSNASGSYTGRIADIEFATKDLKLITTPDVLFTVTVENQNDIITGIDSQVGTQDETIYSVSGIKQNSLKKGVNIIRRADGTTVKQFKGNS